MRRNSSQEQIIREYVRDVLREYDSMETGAYSGTFKDIANAALDPFRVLWAGLKKSVVSGKALLKVLGHTVLSTVLPFYGYKYDNIFREHKQSISKINSRYKAVYDRIYGTLTDKNTLAFVFMASPAYFLSAAVLKTVGSTAKAAVEDVVGESKEVYYTNLINEADVKNQFVAASKAAQAEHKEFLQNVYNEAAAAYNQSLEEFQKNAGEAGKEIEEKIKAAKDEEQKNAIHLALKETAKKAFLDKLKGHLKNIEEQFSATDVPNKPDFDSLEYVQGVKNTIEKIKNLGSGGGKKE